MSKDNENNAEQPVVHLTDMSEEQLKEFEETYQASISKLAEGYQEKVEEAYKKGIAEGYKDGYAKAASEIKAGKAAEVAENPEKEYTVRFKESHTGSWLGEPFKANKGEIRKVCADELKGLIGMGVAELIG